jgi:anti-sigma regulatory factor (Ser/Thr protein kinase)/uncharacterized protein (DUF1330 family)
MRRAYYKKMTLNKEKIMEIAAKRGKLKTSDLVSIFKVSRQYASRMLSELVDSGKLLRVGSRISAFYVLPDFATQHSEILPVKIAKRIRNENLEEHRIINEIESQFPLLLQLSENVRSIFTYAFSEMLNNAIEHSGSEFIEVRVDIHDEKLVFIVNDFGVGVFRNVMRHRHLKSEIEAIQDLLKGKTTTQPKSHSGEGIFFTSKTGDIFRLESFDYQLIVRNDINDVFVNKLKKQKRGTRVIFSISTRSDRHLNDVFEKYTDRFDNDYGFNKTDVKVKLYTIGGVYISRSQARRILSGLEKFKSVILDFDKVPTIGQAFADEVFRVFINKHPEIIIKPINMVDGVKFMVGRVEKNKNHRTRS